MADKEKVIEELEDSRRLTAPQINAKYHRNRLELMIKGIEDVLDLLKEQEQAMKEKDGTISNLIAQIKEISQCYERVVRCKDCVNHFYDKDNIPYCTKCGYGWKDDDFCSKAEPRSVSRR